MVLKRRFSILAAALLTITGCTLTIDNGTVARNEYPYEVRATFPPSWTATLTPSKTPELATPTPEPSSTTRSSPTPTPMPILDEGMRIEDASYGPDGGWVRFEGMYYWTTDQGETWHEFNIPEREGYTLVSVHFIDSWQAWTFWLPEEDLPSDDHSNLEIFKTKNQGRDWVDVNFEADPVEKYNRFKFDSAEILNDELLWIAFNRTLTMNSLAGDIVRTRDGGQTWIQTRLPYSGTVIFISRYIGWTVGSCCTGAPQALYRTLDGGDTWHEQLLVPEPVDDEYYNHYEMPVFLNNRDGIVTVKLKDENYDDLGIAIFHTTDGGYTWERVKVIEDFRGFIIAAQIITSSTYLIQGADGRFITFDNAKTWRRIHEPDISDDYWAGPVMFDPYGYGWVVLNTKEWDRRERQYYLFVTKDWGRTWEAFDTQVFQ